MGIFRSLLVGLAALLLLLPFLFALTGDGILFFQLPPPDVNSVLDNTLVRSLFATDDRHQPKMMRVAVTILYLYQIGIGSSDRQHTAEHRHVHRYRYTHKRFLQSDG